jgi:ferredoxin
MLLVMATLVFNHAGQAHTCTLKAGQRVIAGGYALGFEEKGFADCGGNMVCGTCHVRLLNGGFPAPTEAEQEVLAVFPKVYANSRLACQLKLTDAHQTIEVEWVG